MDDFLTKPVDVDLLSAHVGAVAGPLGDPGRRRASTGSTSTRLEELRELDERHRRGVVRRPSHRQPARRAHRATWRRCDAAAAEGDDDAARARWHTGSPAPPSTWAGPAGGEALRPLGDRRASSSPSGGARGQPRTSRRWRTTGPRSCASPRLSSSSSSSLPSRRAAATILRSSDRLPQPSSMSRLRSLEERLAELGPRLVADLLARRVEDGQLLLREVVVDHLGQLLDGVVEGLGVGAFELEDREQRLVALGVLLLAVLGLVLGDGPLACAAWGRRTAPRRGRARRAGWRRRGAPRRGRWSCRAGRGAASRSVRWSSRMSSTTSPEIGRPRSMGVLVMPSRYPERALARASTFGARPGGQLGPVEDGTGLAAVAPDLEQAERPQRVLRAHRPAERVGARSPCPRPVSASRGPGRWRSPRSGWPRTRPG